MVEKGILFQRRRQSLWAVEIEAYHWDGICGESYELCQGTHQEVFGASVYARKLP